MAQQRPSGIGRLPAFDHDSGLLNAVVEAVRGARNKFKFDPGSGLFIHDNSLPAGATYPFDFGFIPSTSGEDGDPLDVLILMDEPAFVGAVVPSRLVGAIEAEQTENDGSVVRNDRLIAVAHKSHTYDGVREIKDLPATVASEIEHFFISYNSLRGRKFEPLRRVGARTARRLIAMPRRGGRQASR